MISPFVTAVSDYHKFEDVVRHFKNAGIKLKYREVGCFRSVYWSGPRSGYHAVFYEKYDDETKNLIGEWIKIAEGENED